MTSWTRVGVAALLTLLVPGIALAQSATTGAIAGVVKDTTGAVLPGVTVEAASPALIEKVRIATTDDQGNYKIVDLRPGRYTVTFTLAGFSTFKREALDLTTGVTAAASAELRVGSLEETVTVTGASPVVDVQNVRTQKVLSSEVLDALPSGKTISGFTAMTVGITVAAGAQDVGGSKSEIATDITVHGVRGSDRVLFDGMEISALANTGGAASRHIFTNQAAVQETTIETAGMSADSDTGGARVNSVPKDGGNSFRFYFNTSGTTSKLQNDNLTDTLRARGLNAPGKIKKVYDLGFGLGGPIKKDKLWFYYAFRWWGSQEYAPGNYFNKTPHTPVYTPDLSRPAYNDGFQKDPTSVRLTWQATQKNKVGVFYNLQHNCTCFYNVINGIDTPEASRMINYDPASMTQVTWSYPPTNRLLIDFGSTYYFDNQHNELPPGVSTSDIAITESTTGLNYNGYAQGALGNRLFYGANWELVYTQRFSVSYVTGSHAFKTGFDLMYGQDTLESVPNQALGYTFRFGLPLSLTQFAAPQTTRSRVSPNLGIYAQDQWTMKKLTFNLGVRWSHLRTYDPAWTIAAGPFIPSQSFPETTGVNWRDISPRLGAAYDVFGNGKTAIKAFVGKYVYGETTAIANQLHPANSIVTSTTRTWADANGNFTPDCNLQLPTANGECGAFANSLFGTTVINRTYEDGLLEGFNVRPYVLQTSAILQQELRPGMAVNVGYFRNMYRHFPITLRTPSIIDNTLVTPADYDPYCITVPTDARLPNSGQQLCGLYDIKPAKFGQVNNVVRHADKFGDPYEYYHGVDTTVMARFGRGGLLTGGVGVGRSVTDNCFPVDSPQLLQEGSPYCHVVPPWLAATQVKLSGIYPLPWDLQASAVFQNLPGIQRTASYVATNALIAPSLGRNLASGANGSATVPLLPTQTEFEDRINQLDVRLTKIIRVGRARIQGNFDIYNLFNASPILGVRTAYGPTWLQPTAILGARLFKFGAQLDF